MHKFELVCCDTDAITICKPNQEKFNQEEINILTKELNSLFPEEINWEFEFNIPRMIVFKAKNYIMYDGDKIKLKGSALKSSKIESGLKEFNDEVINAIVHNKLDIIQSIYNKYVLEIKNGVKDIKRWSSKKTLTDKVFSSDRANETKIVDAINGSEYKEADKVYLYFKEDGSLCLAEAFNGDYDKDRLYKKLYNSASFFSEVLKDNIFLNYALKRNKKIIQELK